MQRAAGLKIDLQSRYVDVMTMRDFPADVGELRVGQNGCRQTSKAVNEHVLLYVCGRCGHSKLVTMRPASKSSKKSS